ncbi:PilZ domain-containing protein [Methylorubrum salsuginis]|uniref:PilZ domain-containing protein n=1 Tax=Methylorubrum salsuginis TaxID=414703 RepID=A0A1I4CSS4_9HYPH|nr:PilZ domain-containing protein [Methylorubrum salsuginis]SFK84312.1 PilZ domain-containing protein [Methylorubrum salsuginis]
MLIGVERRIDPRHRVGEGGTVALDEHTTIGCLVHDISASGVRITLPDASAIPEVFLLSASCLPEAAVCRVVWRDDETVGARFEG